MHIGAFTYYYYPIINGVVITIADWMRMAEVHNIPVTVFAPQIGGVSGNDPRVVSYPAVPIYRKFGITVPLLPELTLESQLRTREVSLIHVHHPFYIGNVALYFKKKLQVPIVFTYHTRYSDYFRSYFPKLSSIFFEKLVTA